MNRTALAVVALAVGAVLIIALYNVYRPQIDNLTDDVFDKVNNALQSTNMSTILPTLRANLVSLF